MTTEAAAQHLKQLTTDMSDPQPITVARDSGTECAHAGSLNGMVRYVCGMQAKGFRGSKLVDGVAHAKCPKCGRENIIGKPKP